MAYSLVDDPISKTILRCQFNISMNSFIIFSKLKKPPLAFLAAANIKPYFSNIQGLFLYFFILKKEIPN